MYTYVLFTLSIGHLFISIGKSTGGFEVPKCQPCMCVTTSLLNGLGSMHKNSLCFLIYCVSLSFSSFFSPQVLFLSAKNILGGLAAHTRTLRLYPRPVVAFQFECFMKSRPRPCLFTSMLARSQAVEYFAETMLCAHNEAYQRVVAGEYAPELIGDKAQWFASLLTPVLFDTWPEAVTGRPSLSDSTNAFIGSPLLYALVAARLHAGTVDSSVFVGGSDRNTEQLMGDVSKTLSVQDEFSDCPTAPTQSVPSLISYQAVEYFAETMLCAHNEAYQRVVAGEYAPELIGDKAQWFASLLTPVLLFDTWPEAVTGRPSLSDSTNAFIGSPLLYALVAARLHAGTVDSSVFVGGSDRNTEQLMGDVSKTLSVQDEFSDCPTDESASDTETEHSTASVGSTVSDVVSDHLDSGIGEIKHKSAVRAPPDSACDPATKLNGPDPQTIEPVFVCPGEPLPPSLAIHFNPPTHPMLGLSREHTLEPEAHEQPGLEDIPDELSSQTTTDALSTTPENENGRDRKNSQPSSPTDTLRAFTKASVSMFSGGSSRKGSTLDDTRHSVLTDGRINWSSPFFVLLGELFNLNTTFSNDLMRSDEGAKRLEEKKNFLPSSPHIEVWGFVFAGDNRLDEERYLIQAAKSIREGNAPGIFSRSRFVTLLQSESNRNLLLSRLNRCNTLPPSTGSDGQQQYVEDVPIDHWNQYKAIVRTLHQVASGLESSLRSDIFIPTPASIYTPRAQNTNSTVVPLTNGGLASAFGLLELAHTHYYQLPTRTTRTTSSVAAVNLPSGNDLSYTLSSVGSASSLRSDVASGRDLSVCMQASSPPGIAQLNNKQHLPTSPSSYCRTVSTVPLDVASDSEQLGMNVLLSRPMRSMSGGRAQSGSVQSPISPLFERQSGPYQYIPSVSGALPFDEFTAPKSSHSRGYRYRHSKLIKPVVAASSDDSSANTLRTTHRQSLGTLNLNRTVTGTDQVSTNGSFVRTSRTYVFEDLLANTGGTRLQLWDNMQFWEDAFLDAVAQERDILDSLFNDKVAALLRARTAEPDTISSDTDSVNVRFSTMLDAIKSNTTGDFSEALSTFRRRVRDSSFHFQKTASSWYSASIIHLFQSEAELAVANAGLPIVISSPDPDGLQPSDHVVANRECTKSFECETGASNFMLASAKLSSQSSSHKVCLKNKLKAVSNPTTPFYSRRTLHSMDFRPTDLLKHYSMGTPLKRKHSELAEDKLLAGLMHNMIAFMIMMGVNRVDIRRKIRRLLAKSHMGLHYSQEISNLLDVLEYLYGNDIDLRQVKSRAIPHHSYEVYRGINPEGKLLFMEVGEDHLLLRNLSGCVIDRWWYDQLINITYRPNSFILCISVRLNGQSDLNLFYTKKVGEDHLLLRNLSGCVIDRWWYDQLINITYRPNSFILCISVRLNGQSDLNLFYTKKMFISIPNIKCCRVSQHDQFTIEFLGVANSQLVATYAHDCHRTASPAGRQALYSHAQSSIAEQATHLLHHFHVRITSIILTLPSASRDGLQSPASELSKTSLAAH
ncbi:hypothetical protein AHF37_04061 [Paragonimus kellicotti]|nr:hypothetical protein AHF37_04061 [Paragonimus kellicotti]